MRTRASSRFTGELWSPHLVDHFASNDFTGELWSPHLADSDFKFHDLNSEVWGGIGLPTEELRSETSAIGHFSER